MLQKCFPTLFSNGADHKRSLHMRQNSSVRLCLGIGLRRATLECRTAMPSNVPGQTIPFRELLPAMPTDRKTIEAMIHMLYLILPGTNKLVSLALMSFEIMKIRKDLGAGCAYKSVRPRRRWHIQGCSRDRCRQRSSRL